MTRTQIQLPDALYQRAKTFAAQRELSLAEITRRGLEMFLDRYPTEPPKGEWKMPCIKGGGISVPLSELKDLAYEDEMSRYLPKS
jgi:hypothetical protein